MKKAVIVQPKCGRKGIFSDAQEKELEEHIINCSKLFYGLSIELVRKIAFRFAEQNKLKHNFDKTTQIAGKDWYYGFIKRHPNISLRKPEATSLNRISGFNEVEIKTFFNNLETLQNTYHFDADQIYNVDETGIPNVHRNSKILAVKGQKQVGKATSGERGTITTVVCAFSASGKYTPPFFIFKRKRMNPQLLRGGNANIIAAVSETGWINENLFVDWLHHFILFSKPTKERPILLILDNHESHVSLDCFLLCRQHKIILLSLPPHTSHRMQPLDLTYFGPLKTAYNRECDLYMAQNPGRRITQYEIVELFTKAYNRISNIEKAVNGFQAAGIVPLNPNKFDEFFMTSATDSAQSKRLDNDVQTSPDQPDTLFDHSVPLSDIVPLPTMPKKITRQNARKKQSIIITSTPMKEVLEKKKQKKDEKERAEVPKNKKTEINRLKRKGVRNLKNFEENDVKEKEKVPKKKMKEIKNDDKENEYYCIYCSEKYENPPIEDWIMCYKCNLWAHEKCSSAESTSRGFLCDYCIN